MKYLPKLANAPWLLTKAVDLLGGQRPVIMGKGYLKQRHYKGNNYTEVDVDINSSAVAKKIAGQILGYCASCSLNIWEGFVVEGKEGEELPERMVEQHQFFSVDTEIASSELKVEDYNLMDVDGGEE